MDVLLINTKNIKSRPFGVTPPLGLASIGGVLEKNGFSVQVIDLDIKPEDFDVSAYIRKTAPKIIGIGGTSHSRFESFNIARIAKSVSPGILTVYGGCHATFTAEDTLLHISEIDYVVRGEGEFALLELADSLLLGKGRIEDIKGLSHRYQGQIRHNPNRPRITDLDSLYHSRHLLELQDYRIRMDHLLDIPVATIMTARGCPYNCSFCSASAMFGREYIKRSPAKIVEEIRYCIDNYGIRGVRFFDSTFTLDKAHVKDLIAELKKFKPVLRWSCEIRVNTVDRDLLLAMKDSGCYLVDFGVESASECVISNIGKRITVGQVTDVIKWCKELGIRTVAFFSFGHIKETEADSQETLDFIDRYYEDISVVSPIFGMRIYPGTLLESYARENKLLPPGFSWSVPFKNIVYGPIETDNVPILIQPHYGYKELKKSYYRMETIRARKHLKPGNIISRLKSCKSAFDFLHKIYTMFKLAFRARAG